MCGLAGLVGEGAWAGDRSDPLRKMNDAIRHRGPDDYGWRVDGHVALGMRRLSVIDLQGGGQPIDNEAGDVSVVFNGEIYNHHELREDLKAKGHVFRTQSDTEVLVHLYEEYGDDMPLRLSGMFAFAIWDARNARLFCARDRFGMKPFNYRVVPRGLQFCSELRSLSALLGNNLDISGDAVAAYLTFGYVPEGESIFVGVQKLAPAHLLTWSEQDGPKVSRYWHPPAVRPTQATEAELVEELRRLLRTAVTSHMEADVALGAFLSGGVDSSTVVAIMSSASSQPVKTFSIGFAEDEFNEAPLANRVARAFATEHTELIVRPDVESIFEGVVRAFDEPFADSSAIPTYLVAHLARQHVTVALSGDGGDELFGGYSRYQSTLNLPALPSMFRHVLGALGRGLPHSFRGRNRIADFGRSFRARYANQVALAPDLRDGGILRNEYARGIGSLDDVLAAVFQQFSDRDKASQMMLVDTMTYLPGDILTKVDRMTMAVSLEARVPLLDPDLAEFALSLPAEWKIRHGKSKYLLRAAARGLVPDEVLDGPKRGFAVPLAKWFRGPLKHRLEEVLAPDAPSAEYVDRSALTRIVGEHASGRRDHSSVIWRVLVLNEWLRSLRGGLHGHSTPDLLVKA